MTGPKADTTALVFLSEAWLAEAQGAAAQISVDASSLVVTMLVSDGPEGAITYHLAFGGGVVEVLTGDLPEDYVDRGRVSMAMPYSIAAAIAQGQLSAQRAFLDGAIRLGGDASHLLNDDTITSLAAVDDGFADLRARTVY